MLTLLIFITVVSKYADKIYLKTNKWDQNWADLAVAFVCWDMIMNQWSKVFHLKPDIIKKVCTTFHFGPTEFTSVKCCSLVSHNVYLCQPLSTCVYLWPHMQTFNYFHLIVLLFSPVSTRVKYCSLAPIVSNFKQFHPLMPTCV